MPPEVFDGILWELSLEASRRGYDPSLPSRLDCVFACESLQDALTFRDKHRTSGHVYPVEVANSGTRVFRGDYNLISHGPKWGGYTDYLPVNALRYWSEPPSGMVELLIAGAVRISKVSRPRSIGTRIVIERPVAAATSSTSIQ